MLKYGDCDACRNSISIDMQWRILSWVCYGVFWFAIRFFRDSSNRLSNVKYCKVAVERTAHVS